MASPPNPGAVHCVGPGPLVDRIVLPYALTKTLRSQPTKETKNTFTQCKSSLNEWGSARSVQFNQQFQCRDGIVAVSVSSPPLSGQQSSRRATRTPQFRSALRA